jgi:putative secreted protein
MQPTGKDKQETALIVDITSDMLEKMTPANPELKVINHYEKQFYPIATIFQGDGLFENSFSDTGIESWHKNVTDYKPDSLFTVELTLRKVEK